MKNTCPFYTVFQVLKVLFIKNFKIHPLDLLFLVPFIGFYISRYQFLQIFKIHPMLSEKINKFIQMLHPLTGQNPLNMTKLFC